ncbi:hypothetical protein [Microbacterium sp. 3J1]|uniref:hypothetical protein n=1 Tax=Microbacterium sp. 3J1 TaxID=861269 RepID=UPI0020FFFCF3|nr:hypothetical protein [Microbacterium sp. 3J1]
MSTHRPRRRAARITAALAATALALTLAPGAAWATTPAPAPTEAPAPEPSTPPEEVSPGSEEVEEPAPPPAETPAPETPAPETPTAPTPQTEPDDAARDAAPPRNGEDGISELSTKPYMGWSSYSMQVYEGGQWITADQIIAQSDAMHDTLQEYGYEYINIDAGWNGGQDEYGRPIPSATLYPDGLDAVIDHIHDNGQKVGLYLIPGMSLETAQKALPVYGAPGCTTENRSSSLSSRATTGGSATAWTSTTPAPRSTSTRSPTCSASGVWTSSSSTASPPDPE